jgi:hypothetical protein
VLSFVLFGDPRHKMELTVAAIALICGALTIGMIGGVATNKYNRAVSDGTAVETHDIQPLRAGQTRTLYEILLASLVLLGCLAVEACLVYIAANTAAEILGVVVLAAIGVSIFKLRRLRR